MKTVTASPGIVLQLGRQGENNARQIVFDITDWKAEFGTDGTVALLAQRPGETEPYPVDIVVSGSAVTWLVSAADTAKAGIYGQAELQYRIGDVVVKSAIWRTFIADSLGTPSPTPPDPQQAWVDQVLDAAQTVETATANGPKIQGGTWWVWDFESERYVDTGVEAQGPEGPTWSIPTIDLSEAGQISIGSTDLSVVPDTYAALVSAAKFGCAKIILNFMGSLAEVFLPGFCITKVDAYQFSTMAYFHGPVFVSLNLEAGRVVAQIVQVQVVQPESN